MQRKESGKFSGSLDGVGNHGNGKITNNNTIGNWGCGGQPCCAVIFGACITPKRGVMIYLMVFQLLVWHILWPYFYHLSCHMILIKGQYVSSFKEVYNAANFQNSERWEFWWSWDVSSFEEVYTASNFQNSEKWGFLWRGREDQGSITKLKFKIFH